MQAHRFTNRLNFSILGLFLAVVAVGNSSAEPWPHFAAPAYVGDIKHEKLKEISGIEPSSHRDIFWTHNDDDSEFYAMSRSGELVGTFHIRGVRNPEFEDMSCFRIFDKTQFKQFLLLADTGGKRKDCRLFVIEEPDTDAVDKSRSGQPIDCEVRREIAFHYEDHKEHNCEAVAVEVDWQNNVKVLILTKMDTNNHQKDNSAATQLYELKLDMKAPPRNKSLKVEAKSLGAVKSILEVTEGKYRRTQPTALDISEDGTVAIVLTYHHAYAFVRAPDDISDDWARAFSRPPVTIKLPFAFQPEALCFENDAKSFLVTSEHGDSEFRDGYFGRRAPILRVGIEDE